jgi:hypothetical protein
MKASNTGASRCLASLSAIAHKCTDSGLEHPLSAECEPFTGSIRFHHAGFTSSLTLSSKCFATFPHGTCSLSVSWAYLVLDEVYHLLWAAIPNNPTPRRTQSAKASSRTGLSPSPVPQSWETWAVAKAEHAAYTLHFTTFARRDSALDCSQFTRRY